MKQLEQDHKFVAEIMKNTPTRTRFESFSSIGAFCVECDRQNYFAFEYSPQKNQMCWFW